MRLFATAGAMGKTPTFTLNCIMSLLSPELLRRLKQFQLLAARRAFVPKGQPEISQPQSGWLMSPQINPSRRDGGKARVAIARFFHRPAGTKFVFLTPFQPLRGWLISIVASRPPRAGEAAIGMRDARAGVVRVSGIKSLCGSQSHSLS